MGSWVGMCAVQMCEQSQGVSATKCTSSLRKTACKIPCRWEGYPGGTCTEVTPRPDSGRAQHLLHLSLETPAHFSPLRTSLFLPCLCQQELLTGEGHGILSTGGFSGHVGLGPLR